VEQKLGNHISCLFTVQAVHDNHAEKMDNPSNGVSIVGYLRPAFIEEESYLRSLFRGGCNYATVMALHLTGKVIP
jgi:hypothetical protein